MVVPRKLSNLMEQYVIKVCREDILRCKDCANDKIIVGYNDENPYLRLSFYDQYKCSLISYLTSPIFLQLGNYIQEYSDKLLVSTSYLLDHLFKHHKFGISYRALSLTPELVDINKEPQFRDFLDRMIELMSTSHLRPIVSGIYDYKFNNKIIAEIKLLSKIDEYEAAAFNFTLDESIELKRHFNRRLESLKKEHATLVINNQNNANDEHINNISLLHMMIGDLHFYDEEFQEAIIHYLDAVQTMRQKEIKNMPLYEFIVYVRNKLKLGLAYEKNKMFDNALMTFSELTDLIIRKRNIPLRKLGLARFVIPRNYSSHPKSKDINDVISRLDPTIVGQIEDYFNTAGNTEDLVIVGRPKPEIVKGFGPADDDQEYHWKRLYSITEMDQFYALNPKNVIKNINELGINYKPLKTHFLQSTIENVRLLYQSIIAKLFLIQKASPDKLKDIDVIRAIQEFNFIKLPLKTKEKRIIVAEFYNKLGDLLYIVNGTLNQRLKKELLLVVDNSTNKDERMMAQKLLLSPIDATLCYIKSLSILLNPIHRDDEPDKVSKIKLLDYYSTETSSRFNYMEKLKFISIFSKSVRADNLEKILSKIETIIENSSYKERYAVEYISSVANGIVDLCETLLSFTSEERENPVNNIKFLIENGTWVIKPTEINNHLFVDIFTLVKLFKYSSILFESIGEYRVARYQRIKILFVLKNCLPKIRKDLLIGANRFLDTDETLEDFIASSIQLSYKAHEENFKVDDKKIEVFKVDGLEGLIKAESQVFTNLYWFIVQDIIASNENENYSCAIDLFASTTTEGAKDKLDGFIRDNINPTTNIYTKFNRVLSLYLLIARNKVRYREMYLSVNKYLKVGFKDFRFVMKTDAVALRFPLDISDVLDYDSSIYLILNSIGACNEIIKSHNLFDINYVTTNNLELAKVHSEMGYWCDRYEHIKKHFRKKFLDDIIKEHIIFSNSMDYIDPQYHYGLALDYNNRLKDFHSRGKALQTFMKTRSYLDDLFNDDLIHFSLAIERNQLHKMCKDNPQKFHFESIVEKLKLIVKEDKDNFKTRFLF